MEVAAEFIDPLIGKRIGPYRVLKLLGAGGMGAVYLGERDDAQFRKKVAIKVVRLAFGAEELVRRFSIERQTLASLEHPNIVRLLDAGITEDRLPYLVMDYVDGERIDVHCEQRALPVEARLDIFLHVCAAVEYAHQNLIVHCDLKPANILVTPDGEPRLLDFGIAKILTEQDSQKDSTQTIMRPFTPEFASPEQLRGEPISTRSDVYSLGVILYMLITGRSPYRLKTNSPADLVKQVCVEDPDRPSVAVTRSPDEAATTSSPAEGSTEKLRRKLQGDLDDIAGMALRKEPARRYASVGQLAEDIRRHMNGLPVVARKSTFRYRAAKFVTRNKVGVTAAAIVAIVLIAGVASVIRQERIAERERARAEQRFNDVHRLARSMLFDLDDKIKELPESIPARQELVNQALQYLSMLHKEARGDTRLEADLAEGYIKVGDIQGNPYFATIGDYPAGLASYQKALAIAKDILARDAANLDGKKYTAQSYERLASVEPTLGRPKDAVEHARESARIFRELVAAHPTDIDLQRKLSGVLEILGDVLGHGGQITLNDTQGSVNALKEALQVDEAILSRAPTDLRAQRGIAVLLKKIADNDIQRGSMSEARPKYERAIAMMTTVAAADPGNASHRRVLSYLRRGLARALILDDPAAAQKLFLEDVNRLGDVVQREPYNRQARMDLAVVHKDAADLYGRLDQFADSAVHYRAMTDLLSKLLAEHPGDTLTVNRLAEAEMDLGWALGKSGKREEAAQHTLKGLSLYKDIVASKDATADQINWYANNLLTCEPESLRRPAIAIEYAKRAVEMTQEKDANYLTTLAKAYFALGDARKAVEIEEKAVALFPPNETTEMKNVCEVNLAKFRKALKR